MRAALLALLLGLLAQAGPGSDARAAALARRPATELAARDDAARFDPGTGLSPRARERMNAAAAASRRADHVAVLVELWRLLDAEPTCAPAVYQLGVAYFRLRRYEDAVAAFERFLALWPDAPVDTRAYGHCLYSLGEYERARAHYERVLAAHPRSAEALRGLALACLRLGEHERAEELLARVVELAPEHAEAWAWLAQARLERVRLEPALTAARRACVLDPYLPQAWFLCGRALYEIGRDEAAEEAEARFAALEEHAREARALEARLLYEPANAALRARLARLHLDAGDARRAAEVVGEWLAGSPRDVAATIALLDLRELQGDAAGARAAAERLAEVCGDDADGLARLERFRGER